MVVNGYGNGLTDGEQSGIPLERRGIRLRNVEGEAFARGMLFACDGCLAPTKLPGVRSTLRDERDVDGFFAGFLAGEEADGALGFGEGEGVGVEALEGVFAGL
ncbi:MAG: hypothetical protein E6J43_12155, partial [Chloroflexi bacterium]